MADANRGRRPISPHIGIYRPQITSVLSILHRITGVAMALAAMLIAWWFLAAATGPDYFALADGLLTSWVGHLVLLGSLWAVWYHALNGVRHLWWDLGYGFDLPQVTLSGQVVLGASAALTLLTIAVALR